MIITRTPFRISFVGGGTDIPEFYSHHKGAVISSTISKYVYISSHNFFEKNKIRLKYSQTETVSKISEIKHNLLRKILIEMNVTEGLELSSIADIISRTGMGSSSSFTVGVLHNLLTLDNKKSINKYDLAEIAFRIEKTISPLIGKQDQYAASFGGLNLFEFFKNGKVSRTPIVISKDFKNVLNKRLLLFFIGQRETKNDKILNTYDFERKKSNLILLTQLVYDLKKALENESFDDFTLILNEGWKLKKTISNIISNPKVDFIYQTALKNGAKAGKLLGAGNSGFMLLYCEEKFQKKLIESLSGYCSNFEFNFEEEGSKLIFK